MDDQLKSLWDKTLILLKSELSEISFDTWIKTIQPVSMNSTTIYLSVPTEFNKGIIESRHLPLIQNTVKHVTFKEYNINLLIKGEDDARSVRSNYSAYSDGTSSSLLNPRYTFDTFVIGNSNRFAHAASLAVAESPARAYNPLFLYGGVGLGKTHLMHAIGHFILKYNPGEKVMYVTSEHFTNELINAIKDDTNKEFRNKYRSIDVLLIDDIQFIGGKERTQEEFFHTFNTLYEANKQLIISSDKPPKDITTLEERLRSRFEWGLSADIQPPDFETRIAILRKKAQLEKFDVPNEITVFIADKINSNIRELEGALNRVIAYASLTDTSNLTVELANEALKDLLSADSSRKINIPLIQNVVAKYFNMRPDEFKSKRRTREVAFPRQIAMYLCREFTSESLPRVGDEFGGRDHTTVIHACEKISTNLLENIELKKTIDDLRKMLTGK